MLKYYIDSHGQGPEDAQVMRANCFHGTISDDPETFACQVAEYCYPYREGFKCKWPKTFVILKDGVEVGRFVLMRECVSK